MTVQLARARPSSASMLTMSARWPAQTITVSYRVTGYKAHYC